MKYEQGMSIRMAMEVGECYFIEAAICSNSRAINELGQVLRRCLEEEHKSVPGMSVTKLRTTHSIFVLSPRSLHSLPAILHSPHST